MPRKFKYFDQPQVVLNTQRATKEGLQIVKQKYCDELQYASNVGDLLDEVAIQRYIIVPALSAVTPKIDPLEALLASTVAKQAALNASVESFEMRFRKEFKEVKPGNWKRQRVEVFSDRPQGPLHNPQNQQSGIPNERCTSQAQEQPTQVRGSDGRPHKPGN